MKTHVLIISVLILAALLCPFLFSKTSKTTSSAEVNSPEMERLAKAFLGDWDTIESMERSEYFPKGGGRHGTSHWRLGVDGTTLIGEGNSDGSVGPLSYLITIWWDKDAKVYYFVTCFKDADSSCEMRGTAHWEDDTFVNDYKEMEQGKTTKWRDSFIQITPTSHTLIAARDAGDGTMHTLITSKSTRR